ncbi:MAG: response regulator [Deltaproteobacteria bacterium]|nr:response regulator [Deltaproteobacteria bacterium]
MSRRVLIADDAAFFRKLLREMLSEAGFEVVAEAVNGREAVEFARALRPDIVILDVVMPVKSGLEAAREISRLNLPLKIIMCSSIAHDTVVEEAALSGACAYIHKPLDKAAVLDTLISVEDMDF